MVNRDALNTFIESAKNELASRINFLFDKPIIKLGGFNIKYVKHDETTVIIEFLPKEDNKAYWDYSVINLFKEDLKNLLHLRFNENKETFLDSNDIPTSNFYVTLMKFKFDNRDSSLSFIEIDLQINTFKLQK